MNSTLNISSNAVTSPTPPQSRAVPGISPVTQATYSIVSVITILGNMLTILVFIQEKNLLKKSYNKLILSLAIADVLTAITLITNPAFVLGDAFPYPTSPVLGEIYCRVIWSRVPIFQLVVFSVYIVSVLTTERWFAVVKPHKYNDVFNRKKVVGYVIFSWVWSVIITLPGLYETVYNPSSNKICEFRFFRPGSFFRTFVSIFQITMKVIFPCLFIIGLYIHMILKTNKNPVASVESKAKLRGKMTRMIGAVSFILIICLVPNQIYFVLAQAGKTKLDTKTHHFLSLLTFISSCVNPFIYGLSNQNYRHRYRRILFAMCPSVLGEGVGASNVYVAKRARRVQPTIQEGHIL